MRTAIVTGGTRGIGRATCRLLSESGYSVTAFYSTEGADAAEAKRQLPAVRFLRCDVSSEQEVRRAFEGVERLDLLVNNAGVGLFSQVQDTSFDDYERVMNVNAGGVFLCCKHALKKMIERGGAIVNVSSVWGQTGGSCESVYSASKGAVIAFTKALAKELAPSHITVNCVCPGLIATGMNARLSDGELLSLEREIPLGRAGRAEEVASAILFLGTQAYITGEALSVNGGWFIG